MARPVSASSERRRRRDGLVDRRTPRLASRSLRAALAVASTAAALSAPCCVARVDGGSGASTFGRAAFAAPAGCYGLPRGAVAKDSPKLRVGRGGDRLRGTGRRLFGGSGSSEEERLRKENEELRRRLGEGSTKSEGGLLDKIGQGFKSMFGLSKTEQKQDLSTGAGSAGAIAPAALFGLLGAVIKPMFQMMGSLLQASQNDVGMVQEAARQALQRSGRLGSKVECGPIMGQSYSSMNINGQQNARVQLQFQVQGEKGTGTASCSANIANGSVEIQDLRLDGAWVDPTAPAVSGVIDVDSV
eukprot:TRINITY_DN18142_c0_g1_i4.p1 TRINITY_DN18142_c0_g1~~TRINITY_DN18142_c0_g1_i4.p1  ORF type:complete len:331 (+),score=56.70 TRINITY_DN18142_c0_g1_i4:91-993(+)